MSAKLAPASFFRLRAAMLFLCAAAVSGCSSSMLGGTSGDDALKALKWSYGDDGIQVAIHAAPLLNRSAGQAHTLALTVVQFTDPTAFMPYTKDPSKLAQLLLANDAPAGMLSLQRFFITPGEQQTLSLPRAEQAKYVGLAAGYYHLDPPRSTRLYQIGVEIDSTGFLIKSHSAAPAPLKIDLSLGADGILDAPGTRPPALAPTQPKAGLIPTQPPAAPKPDASSPKK
jgi:type VI secretion system VasD/TssJ family lipoprotein